MGPISDLFARAWAGDLTTLRRLQFVAGLI